MSDLLKEAIADAKAVRETALQNAKMALEEAFTPHLKSMLSAKLAEDEYEDDNEDEEDEDEDAEEMARQYREDDDEEMEIEPEDGEDGEDGEEEEYEEGISEEDIIEIDGVKYAPIVTEEDDEEEDENPFAKDDEIEELDLEAVIKELEDELSEDEEVEEDESVNEVDEDEDLDEYSGTRVEKRKKSGNAPRINNEEVEEDLTESDPDEEEKVVKEDSEKVDEDDEKDETNESETNESETSELQNELTEYKEAVTFLRDKLHEVNILNAKLLYTNKLFKEYVLSNDQKLKIVETFDRAQTTREIKLVYTTLAESFKPSVGEKKNDVVKEFASKKSGGTAPKTKIISEENQVADRFRKLAGIL